MHSREDAGAALAKLTALWQETCIMPEKKRFPPRQKGDMA